MIEYRINKASKIDIYKHLVACNNLFIPVLSKKVNLQEYAQKIFDFAETFEAWSDGELIGLIAGYFNDLNTKKAFITNVSVVQIFFHKGIASQLLSNVNDYAVQNDFEAISLEVDSQNERAINFYKKNNYAIIKKDDKSFFMEHKLNIKKMTNKRNYNDELKDTNDHKYAYSFDFDVMHPFMLKSFIPFFKEGNLLELGSFKGDFTKRFLPYFDDITCVEASDEAIAIAKEKLDNKVVFINSLFEKVVLPKKYDNIILTHVLEHIDNPVAVLKRINDEWLSENGRLFLVCPNANAPSRQIAVKMGLISHNSAITPAEKEHGHNITYTLDTLERDVKLSGLRTINRSGIFFKALANFQWDKLLNTDIISKEYLEGCYQLGQQYPDLCSSIFLMCEKGK